MALWYLCVLLLNVATISRSQVLWNTQLRDTSRIPSNFSRQERMATIEALKGAIQIPTVSFSHEKSNTTALAEFGEYIQRVFPTVFHTSFIKHEVVGNYSHLFTVQGSDPSLQPYLLLAHIDVVPAPEEGWEVPPFSGQERDGFIYGRGTLDNKNSVMAILQALELLLLRNYTPQRSFFIALGHDEEISGTDGAQKISALLQSRGVRLAFAVDEGSFVVDNFLPSLKKPIAIIAVSEKGAMDLMLRVNMTPGHSSAPPKETTISILSAAINQLQQNPMPNMFGRGQVKTMLQQLAGEFSSPINIVLRNLWLFQPFVSRFLEKNPITNAMIRTTVAPTVFQAGIKVNVIPPVAQAIINFRIHPAQTVHEVLELTKNIVADDRVEFHVLRAFDPSPVSPTDDQALGYQLLHHTIHAVFPEVSVVAPGTCVGNTDSRHYLNLTRGIYLFNPVLLKPADFRIHGVNERISVQAYETQVKFIFEFIQNADMELVGMPDSPHQHDL